MSLNLTNTFSDEISSKKQETISVITAVKFTVDHENKHVIIYFKKGYADGENTIFSDEEYSTILQDSPESNDYTQWIIDNASAFTTIKNSIYDVIKDNEGYEGTVT